MPGCNISGNVSIGKSTLLGTGSIIIQNTKIGQDCTIGAGAVVIRDVPDGATVTGVPARPRTNG
jgi:acetyltransferase EpsM